MNEFKLPTLQS